jgi:thymidylate synthase ThyX
MILAKAECDSIGPSSDYSRLFTVKARSPKFTHQETLRHRLIYIEDALSGDPDWSFSVSSARAIPFKTLLEEVRSSELRAKPVKWGTEQKGMSPGDELSSEKPTTQIKGKDVPYGFSPRELAELTWRDSANSAADFAEAMAELGVHKSIVNRIIEPYIHVNCIMTGTTLGWLNFFGLRLDKAADPTLRALAEAIWREWNESRPQVLKPGDWHLPFITEQDWDKCSGEIDDIEKVGLYMRKISAARCGGFSYLSWKEPQVYTIGQELERYRLFAESSPIHGSPMEHQATPDTLCYPGSAINGYNGWQESHLAGNLGPGWRQFRKMISGESLAPLPTEYQTV